MSKGKCFGLKLIIVRSKPQWQATPPKSEHATFQGTNWLKATARQDITTRATHLPINERLDDIKRWPTLRVLSANVKITSATQPSKRNKRPHTDGSSFTAPQGKFMQTPQDLTVNFTQPVYGTQ